MAIPIPVVLALRTIATKLLSTVIITKLLEVALFWLLEHFAKRTDNAIDDQIVAEVKALYFNVPVKTSTLPLEPLVSSTNSEVASGVMRGSKAIVEPVRSVGVDDVEAIFKLGDK